MRVRCPPVWFVTTSTNWWCCTHISGCFARLPYDVTLINKSNLRRLDLVDLVITGWPCQSHLRTGAGQRLEDLKSSLFGTLSALCNGGMPSNLFSMVHFKKCTSVGRFSKQGVGRQILCLSIPWWSHLCACRWPWFLFPPALVAWDQPHTSIHFSCNIFYSASFFW